MPPMSTRLPMAETGNFQPDSGGDGPVTFVTSNQGVDALGTGIVASSSDRHGRNTIE